jgi:hypothetical protein
MADALLHSSETTLCAKSGIADQAGLRLPAYQPRSPKLKASPIVASCRSYDHYADSVLPRSPAENILTLTKRYFQRISD